MSYAERAHVESTATAWRRRQPRKWPYGLPDDWATDAVASQEAVAAKLGGVEKVATASAPPALLRRRAVKKMKVDLDAMSASMPSASPSGTGMFGEVVLAPADEHAGGAILCFLSADTFIGFVELAGQDGRQHVLKLNGAETLTECDRAFCNVQDCCGDQAYTLTAQSTSTRGKRTFLARSFGVGDYVAFEGRGVRFQTDFVPGDEQRAEVIDQHFGMLPRAARRDVVLCLGKMSLAWSGDSDKAEAGGGGASSSSSSS